MSPASPEPAARRVTMRPDQQNGHDHAVRHPHHPDTCGLHVAACGTGRTLVGIRLPGTPRSTLTLVAAPTLDLTAQTAPAWRTGGRTEHDAAGRQGSAHRPNPPALPVADRRPAG
ncbi:hypothetical protein [Streptomyces sp. NPDC001380]|uniref:hypothetical protein n=1 Tax=Streptomyces sp. NPDC001380 TaxID=3364566 RepID=UPI0036D0B84A